jgi:transglycosylase-like protein with SLT domain
MPSSGSLQYMSIPFVQAAPYATDIANASAANGIPSILLQSLISKESGFDPNAIGSAGEVGLTQLMPSTAASLGVDPTNITQNINGGAQLLSDLIEQNGGDVAAALSAYNTGSPTSSVGLNYAQSVLANAGLPQDLNINIAQALAMGGTSGTNPLTGSGFSLSSLLNDPFGESGLVLLFILLAVAFVVLGSWKLVKE